MRLFLQHILVFGSIFIKSGGLKQVKHSKSAHRRAFSSRRHALTCSNFMFYWWRPQWLSHKFLTSPFQRPVLIGLILCQHLHDWTSQHLKALRGNYSKASTQLCFSCMMFIVFWSCIWSNLLYLQYWLDPSKTLAEHKDLITSKYALVF